MKLAKFAEKFDMDEDEMIDFLKENGYLKKNGDPSKKGEDYLDEDGNVTDSRSLKEELDEILEDEDEEVQNAYQAWNEALKNTTTDNHWFHMVFCTPECAIDYCQRK